MWQVNTEKCFQLFDRVYVSTDSFTIFKQALLLGADAIIRDESLCGDTPNIPVYQHALKHMKPTPTAIVAVQVNSPNIDPKVIEAVKALLERGYEEVMTCHEDYRIYGSVWGLSTERLQVYGDPYHPMPSSLIVDTSIDIHTKEDYDKAISITT